jgi:hypothetical protein
VVSSRHRYLAYTHLTSAYLALLLYQVEWELLTLTLKGQRLLQVQPHRSCAGAGRYVPRAVLMDLEPGTMDSVSRLTLLTLVGTCFFGVAGQMLIT